MILDYRVDPKCHHMHPQKREAERDRTARQCGACEAAQTERGRCWPQPPERCGRQPRSAGAPEVGRGQEQSAVEPSEGAGPADTMMSVRRPPEPRENTCL